MNTSPLSRRLAAALVVALTAACTGRYEPYGRVLNLPPRAPPMPAPVVQAPAPDPAAIWPRPGDQKFASYWAQTIGDRVFFETDRSDIGPAARAVLTRQAQYLNLFPDLTMTIEGHTDERGTRNYNLALGQRRADAVRRFLVALGIDSRRLRVLSAGKERPNPNCLGSTPADWQCNRRAVSAIGGLTVN